VPAIITEEHRIANSESERERLKAAGGKLAHARGPDGRPGGPLRLWPGGVAQARAIGDADVGSFIKPDPAVCTHRFPSVGFVIVVCSDGVWDAMLPTAVGALARKLVRVPSNHAAEMIVDAAVSQLHAYDCDGFKIPRDDTTCVLMRVRFAGDTSEQAGSCFTKKKKVIPPGSSPPKPEVFEKEDVDSEEVAQAVAEAVAEAGGPKPDAAPTEGKVGDSA